MKVPLQRYIELLGKYMLPQRWQVVGLTTAVFTTIGLQLVNPQIMRYFIDAAIDTTPTAPPLSALTLAALAFLCVAITAQLISLASTYLGGCIAWNATNALREDLASHCLRLDMSFHKSRTPGELIQRIDGDVGVLGSYFSTFLVTIAGNVLLLLGILVILFYESTMIGFVLTGCTILMLAGLYCLRRIAVPYNIALFQSYSELFGFIGERLSGKEDVRASGAIACAATALCAHQEGLSHVPDERLCEHYNSMDNDVIHADHPCRLIGTGRLSIPERGDYIGNRFHAAPVYSNLAGAIDDDLYADPAVPAIRCQR